MMNKTTQPSKSRNGQKCFFGLALERIRHFEKQGKKKTADNCACALRHFKQFRKGEETATEELSAGMMKDFQSYLISQGMRMNTVSLYNRQLRAVYNYALDEEIITTDRRPFRKSFTGREKTRKRAVDAGIVKKLSSFSPIGQENLEFTRDLFLLSIYMQGIPFVDLAHLRKEQVRNGYVIYQRRKTNRQLKVKLHPQAQRIINRYRMADSACPYLLPILYNPRKGAARNYAAALRVYNKHLNRLSALLKLDEPLTSYVARHTWASLARQCGTSDTVICEALGHSHVGITSIYLASLDVGMVALANKKVIVALSRGDDIRQKMQKNKRKESLRL